MRCSDPGVGNVCGPRLLMMVLLGWCRICRGLAFRLRNYRRVSGVFGTFLQWRFESRNFTFVGRRLGSFRGLNEPMFNRRELVDKRMS